MTVRVSRAGAVAHVELDNPPVNAIGQAQRQGLMEALDWVEGQHGLERVVLTGAGKTFCAGGDAREFDGPPLPPHLPDVLLRIEASPVPWIAAAEGAALGGGLELMLACRGRVAAPKAKLGLPEVTLGTVPGAGGTQRLPRLIGLVSAADLIGTGKPVDAGEALDMGLVDLVADDPRAAAQTLDLSRLRPAVSSLPAPSGDPSLAEVRDRILRRAGGQDAPRRALDLVALAATLPFAEAARQEREAFLTLRASDQARALRHIFFAERQARAPDGLTAAPVPLARVAVVGGGTMGAGIAYAFLSAGLVVTILEADDGGVDRARANVDRIVADSRKRGLLSDDRAARLAAALTIGTDYGLAAQADLAIEAAFESMEVKTAVLRALEAAVPPGAVLATNTSYLDLDAIAATLRDPSRLVGLHFFAPAHVMRLLEIVRGAQTSDVALATAFDVARRLRKVPVLSGVCDGFIGNRILARYREAADTLLMDGASPWDIDRAMVEFGYAMGPYEAQDLSGHDIAFANRRRQDATRDPRRRYIPIADRMVAEGRLGRKAGRGWYLYDEGTKAPDPSVDALIADEARKAGVTRTAFTDDEIRHRLILAMVNEAADILHEGIAQSAADIDLVTVFGYGFPRWRGGLMHHADTLGPAAVLAGLDALAAEDGLAWRPSPLIRDLAARGLGFADWRPRT